MVGVVYFRVWDLGGELEERTVLVRWDLLLKDWMFKCEGVCEFLY
jgi:hypothetical protein